MEVGGRQGLVSSKIQGKSLKIIENVGFRAKIMFFLDFSFSAASGMLVTPPDAPQSYSRKRFHNIMIFHERCRRVGGRQGLVVGEMQGTPSKFIEMLIFDRKS